MRLARTMIVFGIAILASSLLTYYQFGSSSWVDLGDYDGRMFRASGGFHLVVSSEQGGELNVYVLTGPDILRAIRDASLENVIPIGSAENTLYYETVVEVFSPGWYGVLVTPNHNETADYRVEVESLSPDSGLFAYGLVLVFLGTVFLVSRRIVSRPLMSHSVAC